MDTDKMLTLNPATTHEFTDKDLLFVTELSKVGYVHLHTSQVTLMSEHDKGIQFREYSSDAELNCDGLSLPKNWTIEGIYQGGGFIRMTFGVSK